MRQLTADFKKKIKSDGDMAIKFIDAILENDDAKRHLETQLQEKLKSLALAHESEEKETLARATKRASTAAQVASKLNGNGKSP